MCGEGGWWALTSLILPQLAASWGENAVKRPISQWLFWAPHQEEGCTCQTEERCNHGTQISWPVRKVGGVEGYMLKQWRWIDAVHSLETQKAQIARHRCRNKLLPTLLQRWDHQWWAEPVHTATRSFSLDPWWRTMESSRDETRWLHVHNYYGLQLTCLLNPCLSSSTKVMYTLHGNSMIVEYVSTIKRNTTVCFTYRITWNTMKLLHCMWWVVPHELNHIQSIQ